VQETFLKVHRGLRHFRGEASLRTWILRVAVRCAIDLRRRSRSFREIAATREPSYDPRSEMDATLARQRLEALAGGVDGQQGVILRLRLFGGLSNGEIAAQLGLREPNVRMQLSKALRRLREKL
jgi:RNA polymerase sigma-70 factor (ECF subfamily)